MRNAAIQRNPCSLLLLLALANVRDQVWGVGYDGPWGLMGRIGQAIHWGSVLWACAN